MKLDVFTLVAVDGLGHLLQLMALALQFAINRTYRGIGWWLAWSAAVAAGFGFTLLRRVPSLLLVCILGQNILIILGVTFFYVGLIRFLGRTERWKVLGPILASFAVLFLLFLFVKDDIVVRSMIICATLAALFFLASWDLHVSKTQATAASAAFLEWVIAVTGLYFALRAGALPFIGLYGDIFAPTVFNILPYVVSLIAGNLLTLGAILMVNQRSHAEMMEARDHFEMLFETSPDAVLITRLTDGVCRNVNEGFESLSGFKREEILGRSAVDLELYQDPADREKVVAKLREAGETSNIEIPFRQRDGRPFVGSMSARVIHLQGVPHIISVTRDVTDKKRVEEAKEQNAREIQALNLGLEKRVAERTAELEESNRELAAFTYTVAHDLRAPLRAMHGFSSMVSKDYEGRLDAEAQRMLGVVCTNALRMGQLVDSMLAFSNLNRTELKPRKIAMQAMVRSVLFEICGGPLEEQKINFDLQDLPDAYGDATLIRQVWQHLLANAVKFSAGKERPFIRVTGATEGKSLVYRVADNGAGFDMKYAKKLFGVFHRLHGVDEFEGMGIGLAVVHRIITRHGGKVWAEGVPGEGATLSFSLPAPHDGTVGERTASS